MSLPTKNRVQNVIGLKYKNVEVGRPDIHNSDSAATAILATRSLISNFALAVSFVLAISFPSFALSSESCNLVNISINSIEYLIPEEIAEEISQLAKYEGRFDKATDAILAEVKKQSWNWEPSCK